MSQPNQITSRRDILKWSTAAMLAGVATARGQTATSPARPFSPSRFKLRPDLLDAAVRDRMELVQLTTDPEVGGTHIYMESQVFTPDAKHFVLQRSGHAHGSDRSDPNHQFMRCDIDDGFSLHPLTDELGTTGPSVSPDGKYLYYFVDETAGRGRRVLLNRVNLDGTDRRTLLLIDHKLPGTSFRLGKLYPLSTISSDGNRLAISARLEDGRTQPAPYGLMVFDLHRASVDLVIHGPSWINMHPQYCRSTDAVHMHDILIQENHGNEMNEKGEMVRLTGGAGADIHVIRDDGTNFRDMPWGRDGKEFCQGHQCWRGRTGWAITSTQVNPSGDAELIESKPVLPAGHIGIASPGGIRNMLSREIPKPRFYHFATDISAARFITDAEPFSPAGRVMIARFGKPGEEPLVDWVCIARPKPSGNKNAHMHPFLSPDGKMGFFNSDESGRTQAYMVRGL